MNFFKLRSCIWLAISLVTILSPSSCMIENQDIEMVQTEKIFHQLSTEETNIEFTNHLTENDSLNYFTYGYIYMGGGIAVGDINNDGLNDLFFTGNQVENKLYLNQGGLTFQDITNDAGVSGDHRWYTGVTMADVNADGFLDIYCTVSGKFEPRNNQLFINNQDGTFTEKAEEYGIDDEGHGVQSTFFDYDLDGDLDLYIANYPPTPFDSPVFVYEMEIKTSPITKRNRLYENRNGAFIDVSEQSGVAKFGLSLSATIGDLNNDHWPDIYVSNDFATPDYLFINNKDGTFKEVIKEATSHTSFYGMGVDIADYNNDGFLDVFQVDMDSKNHRRQKANMASMNPDLFWGTVNAGFHYQYMQNSLQQNSGIIENGIPHFSNVSRISHTSSTDWSWGPLFADFDNDGKKDLFITNGTRKEINNNDFFKGLADIPEDSLLHYSKNIPEEKIDNVIFKNEGQYNFKPYNDQWGIEYKGFSNGVVYNDLDNDGDLEIVINNIDDNAIVFENKSSDKNHFLNITFKGQTHNEFGIGTRVYLKSNEGEIQMQELTLSRGFQSSVAPELHFGLGEQQQIDLIKVVWPDGKIEERQHVNANQDLRFQYTDALEFDELNQLPVEEKLMVKSEDFFPSYLHEENGYDDFDDQILLPHKMSSLGPYVTVGDVDSDGKQDYYIGGSSSYAGSIFIQENNGFIQKSNQSFLDDKNAEDMGSVFFDVDNDGDQDLYVSSGGYEHTENQLLTDRLYINDGKGNFTKQELDIFSKYATSSSQVIANDFDNDGKKDLLVLGRQEPKNYPQSVSSYLLKNQSNSESISFIEMISGENPFKNLGMVTSAVVTDFNSDGLDDIIIVGEWMPILLFENTGSTFKEVSENYGLTKNKTKGWWWSINQGDFDNDGDSDFIIGNNGNNYKYQADSKEPFDLYVNDFDKNNENDLVLSYYSEGKQFPVRGKQCSAQQIPSIDQKFNNYQSFAEADLSEIYTKESLKNADHYQVNTFESIYLENKGNHFKINSLPLEVQLSSVRDILIDDFDNDGFLDALLAGNLFESEVETPKNDASIGLFLKGQGDGSFQPILGRESGFFAPGNVRGLSKLTANKNDYIVVAINNDYMKYFRINNIKKPIKNKL